MGNAMYESDSGLSNAINVDGGYSRRVFGLRARIDLRVPS